MHPQFMRLKALLILGIFASTMLAGCAIAPVNSSAQASPLAAEDMATNDHAMTMDLGPKDAEFDLRFIDGMILHHQGAIIMAEAALQHSDRDEIKTLATAIVSAQQGEIEQMQQWRKQWYPNAGPDPVMYHAGQQHTMSSEMQAEMMMSADLGTADANFDLRFINGMIPHHQGALDMAQQVLEHSDRPELQQLAQAILSSQQQEIDQMKQWQRDWYPQ